MLQPRSMTALVSFQPPCEACDGSGNLVVLDADGDGICDADEVLGCIDPWPATTTAHRRPTPIPNSPHPFASGCESCSGAQDGSGTILANDEDGDGVCDEDEVPGCTDATACNFNDLATDNDGSCTFTDGQCQTCEEGVIVDNDEDGDGVCDADEVPGCTDAMACNFSGLATDDDGSATSTAPAKLARTGSSWPTTMTGTASAMPTRSMAAPIRKHATTTPPSPKMTAPACLPRAMRDVRERTACRQRPRWRQHL